MNKVFITGGTGLVGSHIVEEYIRNGWRVTVLTRNLKRAYLRFPNRNVQFVVGNVLKPEGFADCLKGHNLLIHAAAFHASCAPGHEQNFFSVNVDGTRNILRLCEQAAIENIIYTSSTKSIGYSPNLQLQNESVEYNLSPIDSAYGRSKAQAEELVLQYQGRLNIKILNPTAVIGRYDREPTPTGSLILKAIAERIHFYLDMPLSFVDVSDVARAHFLVHSIGKPNQRYILAAAAISMRDFFRFVDMITGRKRPLVKVPFCVLGPAANLFSVLAKLTHLHPPVTKSGAKIAKSKIVYDGAKAKQTFGFKYRDTYDSLADALSWFSGICPQLNTD